MMSNAYESITFLLCTSSSPRTTVLSLFLVPPTHPLDHRLSQFLVTLFTSSFISRFSHSGPTHLVAPLTSRARHPRKTFLLHPHPTLPFVRKHAGLGATSHLWQCVTNCDGCGLALHSITYQIGRLPPALHAQSPFNWGFFWVFI